MYKTQKWKDWISSGLNKVKDAMNDPFEIMKYLEDNNDRYPKNLYVKFSRKNILSDSDSWERCKRFSNNFRGDHKLYFGGSEYYRMNVLDDFITAYENKDIYCVGCKADFYYDTIFIYRSSEKIKKSEEIFEKLL